MKIQLLHLIFIQTLHIEFSTGCRTNVIYFPEKPASGIAIMKGAYNGTPITGTITFKQESLTENVKIFISISGIDSSSQKHAIYIQELGIQDSSDDTTLRCGSSGNHFNPLNQGHGDITDRTRHVGDYGNVQSDKSGVIMTEIVDNYSQLFGPFGIIGRTIVLHLNEGNNKAQFDAGPIIACGVIGISN